ncbi:MAG: asparagine synthase (glutamine-hydrolyzing) [Armatimonadota bacterium]|nr:asparagine synthase (glutamine-hydrolyzing) [Armatimonadota bacterium]
MCGIVGYWSQKEPPDGMLIAAMAQQLYHRGPDSAGVWLDEVAGVALGHRRLAILDLSPAGHQPMLSFCNRYVLVYNGEIYNHLELRAQLEARCGGFSWRGHSDTETLLAAISVWGVEATLRKAVGMFAFAVWDRHERCLTLARDRMGEKPLYYGYQNGVFMFASELKALVKHPSFEGCINTNALAAYLQLGYIPAPLSIYESIYKLPPGTFLTVGEEDLIRQRLPDPSPYWSLLSASSKMSHDEQEAIDQLEEALRQSIRGQMIADVPVGAFLSGGIDSSTVVALMQVESSSPVRTFTIGFHERFYNEAPHAKAVAAYLGTDHTEHYVTPSEAIEVIPSLPHIYDEPFADPSQIPTFLVARLARNQVTVCLSGDGGDELFAGYPRYHFSLTVAWWLQHYAKIPYWLRCLAARAFESIPTGVLNYFVPARYLQQFVTRRLLSHHKRRLAQLLRLEEPTLMNVYRFFASDGTDPNILMAEEAKPFDWSPVPDWDDPYLLMCYLDAITYLPDDILVKVDRATMAVSLEARVPLLDHRVVEYAWQLPSSLKVRNGKGKWILRQVLYRYVPAELVERPKSGFAVPLHAWLRGSLREWAEELLSEGSLRSSGLLNSRAIRQFWDEHQARSHNWEYLLWKVLMFQAWFIDQAKRHG